MSNLAGGSEYGEDIWIKENVPLPEKGFYLDIGCAWPVLFSNTSFLREKGWDGLAIDGNPRYSQWWNGMKEFHCAVLSGGEMAKFDFNGVPELSRIGVGELVKTRRLEEFLLEVPKIDLISCDLEGHEFNVLSTLNWNRYRPQVVVSEYSTFGLGEDYRVRDMLLKMGYRIAHETKANLIFTL